MKVLMFNGSPHEKGCTYTALAEVASSLSAEGIESEIYWLGASPIASCLSCGLCRKMGSCAINDGVADISARLSEFDGFIFASPVHYAAASGAATSFFGRLFYSCSAEFRDKPAACIVSCRRAGSTAALDQLLKFPLNAGMTVVGSQYWPMVHGNTPEEVKQDGEGMQIMRTLGKNMAFVIKCIDAGKKAGLTYPEREPRIGTNFIRN